MKTLTEEEFNYLYEAVTTFCEMSGEDFKENPGKAEKIDSGWRKIQQLLPEEAKNWK